MMKNIDIIIEKNKDISKRIKKFGFDTAYIKGDDVMLISIGMFIDQNTILHYEPFTYKITGFTMLRFSDNFNNYLIQIIKQLD